MGIDAEPPPVSDRRGWPGNGNEETALLLASQGAGNDTHRAGKALRNEPFRGMLFDSER